MLSGLEAARPVCCKWFLARRTVGRYSFDLVVELFWWFIFGRFCVEDFVYCVFLGDCSTLL